MARVARLSGMLPLVSAFAMATALTGAAVLTVSAAQCGDPGHYVQRNGQVMLLGGCLSPADVPAAPEQSRTAIQRHEHGSYGEAHW
ncbi:MAG: hypothetical protein ACRDQ5_00445 [Sciscionella sp.]